MMFKALYQRHFYWKNIFTGIQNLTTRVTCRTMDIQSFIFFDIETTGLPQEEYNKTKITELCFTVVQADHISLGVYPRAQNKLMFCFNPQKRISPKSTEITGLTNDLLEFQPTFSSKTCDTINSFLELCRRPICFVAHNGNNFDYPILKSELHKAGCKLIDNILCIDSLQMFRDLDKNNLLAYEQNENENSLEKRNTNISNQKNMKDVIGIDHSPIHCLPTQKDIPIELCDGFDELLFDTVASVETSLNSNIKEVEILNENTPKKLNNVNKNNNNQNNNVLQDELYYIPTSSNGKKNESYVKHDLCTKTSKSSAVKKKLNFGKSYKLVDVYKRLTTKDCQSAHLADQDVNMLIECAATLGQEFVDWANGNAKYFDDIPMMKPGVKLGS